MVVFALLVFFLMAVGTGRLLGSPPEDAAAETG
jgi:hypothetical protein